MTEALRSIHSWLQHRNPSARQWLIGVSLAYDPAPTHRFWTYCNSDGAAVRRDWEAVASDMHAAIEKCRNERQAAAE